MSQPIIQPRITPPKLPKNIISRLRLVKLLDQNKDKSLILICSKAGSGKTTLVQNFLQKSGLNYGWMTASTDISDFYSFMEYVTYALKQTNAKFGSNTLAIIDSARKALDITENITTVAGTFINEVYQNFKGDIILVIDDFHNLGNRTWLREAFDFLLENLPEKLHLIITSRESPAFNTVRLNSKRKLFELKSGELNFDVPETKELLAKMYSVSASEERSKQFRDNLEGWITGMHLMLQVYGKNFDAHKTDLPENLFDFFVEEIFTGLEHEIQNFLLTTSLLDNFDEAVCNSLLKINGSGNIIHELLKRNVFIEQTQMGNYNYSPLFRDFLSSKTDVGKNKEMLAKIAEYYDRQNDKISSIKYLLRGDNFKKAAEEIIPVSTKLVEEGRFEILWNWVNAIKKEVLSNDPRLLLLTARIHRQYTGDFEKSLYYINKAVRLSENQNKTSLLTESLILKADLLLLTGKDKEALDILTGLLKLNNSPENEGNIYHHIGRIHNSNSQYNEAIESLNKSLSICKREGLDYLKNNNLTLLSSIYMMRGEFIKSIHFNEQVVVGERDVMRRLRQFTPSIFLNAYSGRYEKAKKLLDEERGMLDIFPGEQLKLGLDYGEGKVRSIVGDYEGSCEILNSVVTLAIKLKREYYLYPSYMLLAENYHKLGKHDKAFQYYELCSQYVDSNNRDQNAAYAAFNAMMRTRKTDNAKNLLDALDYFRTNNFYLETAQICFHLADYYLRANDTGKALKFLEDSLKLASENEYIPLYENKVSDYRELLDFAVTNNVYKDFIKKIIQGFIFKPEFEWLSQECRERLLSDVENFYDVKMTSSGFIVRGKPVEEKLWTRKKSKVILGYLISNSGIRLTKDQAVDLFFPELPMDKAEPMFYNSITNIRNALGNKNIVLYEDKILRLNPELYYKAELDISPGKG